MLCEAYRKTLSEAALSGERLPTEAPLHLAGCPSCRESFLQEKALFERIEGEVQARVNAEVPPSLLPKLRQEIDASGAERTWRAPVLAYVASGVAIGVIALSFALRSKVSIVKPEFPIGVVSSLPRNETSASQKKNGQSPMLVATNRKNRRPARAVVHAEPEVLVSTEEQRGLQSYAASLRSGRAEAPVVKVVVSPEIEPLEIAGVEVKPLSIQPLENGVAN